MGKILGDRFELVAEAARGGMGSVHRGKDLKTGQMVAVKVLELDRPFDLIRFQREAQVLAGLAHPNIVRYISHGESAGTHFLVQEWVDGVTLSTQLSTIGVTARDAVVIGIGVAEALGAAHDAGIVHRDVKPANIILDGGVPEQVKLVDFGIARAEAEAGVLTRAGVLVGTPSYMAPEQARGEIEITPAADVWALGCVLYEAIAGLKVFAGRTPEAIRAKALLHDPEHLELHAPEIPAALSDLVHSMLHKHAARRPQGGREVAQELRRVLPAIGEGPTRRAGYSERLATQVMSSKTPSRKPARCFVMVSVPPAEDRAPAPVPLDFLAISEKHGMRVHTLDARSVLLEAGAEDAPGAVSAVYAALEIQQVVPDGAFSVFAQAEEEQLDAAIDRGSESLADVTMAALFADAVGADPAIPIDNVIATLLENENIDATIVTIESGPAVLANRSNAS